jgi:hypothetical protein
MTYLEIPGRLSAASARVPEYGLQVKVVLKLRIGLGGGVNDIEPTILKTRGVKIALRHLRNTL